MNSKKANRYVKKYEQLVCEAAQYLRPKPHDMPRFGIVLGSGLSELVNCMEIDKTIDYAKIPNFPTPTIKGHAGRLHIGSLEGVPLIALEGRKHYYEVADLPRNVGMLQVTFAVHVLAELGVQNYFVTNAAGGLNQNARIGDAMAITSHINTLPNPLLGKKRAFPTIAGEETARFQPMNNTYDPGMTEMLSDVIAESHMAEPYQEKTPAREREKTNICRTRCINGTYLAVTGPSYETDAESVAYRSLGADAVGMSTTPEVIVARNRGMNVVGFSCITNKIAWDGANATSHEEVTAVLNNAATKERLAGVVREFFRRQKRELSR